MPGGFDVTVKSQGSIPASYYCVHCKKLLKQAVQTREGDRLCLECAKEIARLPTSTCTGCTILVKSVEECYPDVANRKEIMNIGVLCEHHTGVQKCPWTGKLKDLETHTAQCEYKKVQCKACNDYILESRTTQHLKEDCPEREIECDYCSARIVAKDQQLHYGCCQFYPLECPHCSATVQRAKMNAHQEGECTHVKCACGKVVERQTRGDHIWSTKHGIFDHLRAVSAVVNTGDAAYVKEVHAVQESQKYTTTQLVDHQEKMEDVYKRLNKIEDNVQELKARPLVPTVPEGGETFAEHLRREMADVKKMLFSLTARVDQLEEKGIPNPEASEEQEPSEVGRKTSLSVVDKLKFLEDKVIEVEKTTNILSVRHSELELQLQASLASTYTGEFIWRIPDVQRRIREAKSAQVSSIYSPPFYTGKTGYKMCVRCYLNGDGLGESKFISLFFVIMKGEYDALLQWPFDRKVTMTLLAIDPEDVPKVQIIRPNASSSSFSRPREDMNIASGCPEFALQSVLQNSSYVQDDTMFLRIKVIDHRDQQYQQGDLPSHEDILVWACCLCSDRPTSLF